MQLSKIYTRGGDKGQTQLVTGQRVAKDHYLIDLTGSFDELNCHLGLLRTAFIEHPKHELFEEKAANVLALLPRLQNTLFDIGSLLSCDPSDIPAGLPEVNQELIEILEKQMDEMNENLEPLPSFVLPGGSETNARAHMARAFCRTVERKLVTVIEDLSERQKAHVLSFINRLSDWLFTVSRMAAKIEGKPEFLWDHPIKNKK